MIAAGVAQKGVRRALISTRLPLPQLLGAIVILMNPDEVKEPGDGKKAEDGLKADGANSEDKPSLLDPKGETHVLDGDKTGGGHRSGTGKPGKSEFPSGWSDDRIKGEISDVATDPASSRAPGRGGREVVRGTRGGIDIEVIVEPNGRIVTGYPTNVPRNPR